MKRIHNAHVTSTRLSMETARLRLRIVRPADEEFLAELYADPAVMEHVHDGAVSWEEALLDARVDVELAAHRHSTGTWLVETRDGFAHLGRVQFSKLAGGDRDDFQLGYQFAPAHWGRGYATEAAGRLLSYGFEALRLDRVVALVRKDLGRQIPANSPRCKKPSGTLALDFLGGNENVRAIHREARPPAVPD
jgi:RimJ/RimL family protein N-acetyltransferase